MIQGFLSALKTIGWAAILLSFILSIWSLIAVTVLHPIATDLDRNGEFDGCERCGRAFSSIFTAMVTMLQTVLIGDSWSRVAMPMIESEPWTILIFGAIWASVAVGMMNLILAGIVDSAAQERQNDDDFQEKAAALHAALVRKKFVGICKDLDTDGDGTLTRDELLEAYTSKPEIQKLFATLALDVAELDNLLLLADKDGNGTVEYEELSTTLIKIKSMDVGTMVALLKQDVAEVKAHAPATKTILDKMDVGTMVALLKQDVAEVKAHASVTKAILEKNDC